MKPVQLLPFLLVGLLAFVGKGQARSASSYHIQVPDSIPNEPTYAWFVGDEEEQRISDMLEHDVSELGFLGFYMNVPPMECPHCGKKTEIIDWVYTALKRGIHSKEWIVKALRDGKLSQKNAHDVYCSGCGHLTLFRDPTGDEGGVKHISNAVPYDRTTKTFMIEKRDEDASAATAGEEGSDAPPPAWHPIWLIKKSDEEEAAATTVNEVTPDIDPPHAWHPFWLIKKESETEESTAVEDSVAADPPPHAWHPIWLIKKESEAEDNTADEDSVAADPPPHAWHPIWLIKKTDTPEASATEPLAEESADPSVDTPYSWYTQWMIKKADAET